MPYLGLIVMILWIVCLVDVIVADEYAVRNIPKVGWVIVVLLLPLIGSVLWLVAGRPRAASPRLDARSRRRCIRSTSVRVGTSRRIRRPTRSSCAAAANERRSSAGSGASNVGRSRGSDRSRGSGPACPVWFPFTGT